MSIHNYFNKNLFKKELIFFTALYFSLIIGFLLGENSSGGAFLDYLNLLVYQKLNIGYLLLRNFRQEMHIMMA